jgi:hypothetical protein
VFVDVFGGGFFENEGVGEGGEFRERVRVEEDLGGGRTRSFNEGGDREDNVVREAER